MIYHLLKFLGALTLISLAALTVPHGEVLAKLMIAAFIWVAVGKED